MTLKRTGQILIAVGLGFALAIAIAVAAGASSGLKNEGGRTPMTKTVTIAPHQEISVNGPWAKASVSKLTVTITGGGDIPVAKCGPAAPDCYVFMGQGVITGTFRTLPHAPTPRAVAGKRITGSAPGTFTETFQWDFQASGYPYAKVAPGNVTGMNLATFYKQFFGAGTRFGGPGLTSDTIVFKSCGQTWTYTLADKGQAKADGNITGRGTC